MIFLVVLELVVTSITSLFVVFWICYSLTGLFVVGIKVVGAPELDYIFYISPPTSRMFNLTLQLPNTESIKLFFFYMKDLIDLLKSTILIVRLIIYKLKSQN